MAASPTASSHVLRRLRVLSALQAPSDRRMIKRVSPIELPDGHRRVSITKDSVYPAVANREHRPP